MNVTITISISKGNIKLFSQLITENTSLYITAIRNLKKINAGYLLLQ